MDEKVLTAHVEAGLHFENGDYEPAAKAAQASLDASKASQQPSLALGILARAKLALGDAAAADKLVNDALAAGTSVSIEEQAAAQLAAVELRLGQGNAEEALEPARALKSLSQDLGAGGPMARRLQTMALAEQVKLQIARGSLDDAMRGSMELLAAAQKRGNDKGAEGSAWLNISEVHSKRETALSGAGTSSTPEETLQAAERAAEIFREAANTQGNSLSDAEVQAGLASAITLIGQARLRLGRHRQAADAAGEAAGLFRNLGRSYYLTGALGVELEARRALMEPMIGLQSANKELQQIREGRGNAAGAAGRGARLAEATILHLIARTHAVLSEPLGAVRNALLATQLHHDIGNHEGEALSLLLASEQQKNLGEMVEATETAERALKAAQKAKKSEIEDHALKQLSSLLADRGLNDKAPMRPQALQALDSLVTAIKARDAPAAKEAENLLTSFGTLVNNKDIADQLVPLLARDPEAGDFLRDLGWDVEKPFSQVQVGKEIRNLDFYLVHRFTGMGFGPQFRQCHPVRVNGSFPVAVSVNELPETEAWQMELMLRPGFLDAGLQSGMVHTPFFDEPTMNRKYPY